MKMGMLHRRAGSRSRRLRRWLGQASCAVHRPRSRRTLPSSRPVPPVPTPCPRVRAVAPSRTSWRTTSTPATRWGAVASPATTPTPPAHPGQRQHQLVRGDQAPSLSIIPTPCDAPRES